MASNPLIGTWRLVSWENRSAEGQISYPLGQDATGYITYNEDGYMFVALMRPNRPKFATADLFKGSVAEKVSASESYVSYCGRYEIQADKVIHHVELSLFPNWIEGDQERIFERRGNQLILSAHPFLMDGIKQTPRLVWERV